MDLCEGGGNCLKYLKRGWNGKEGKGHKDLKKGGGGKLGQEAGALKRGEIYRKTPVCWSFSFDKITGSLQLYNKKRFAQLFPCKFCKFFKSTYFEELEELKGLEKIIV